MEWIDMRYDSNLNFISYVGRPFGRSFTFSVINVVSAAAAAARVTQKYVNEKKVK